MSSHRTHSINLASLIQKANMNTTQQTLDRDADIARIDAHTTAMTNKLSATFRGTTRPIPFSHPMMKALQTHFMYFVDDIQRGPEYDRSKFGFFVLKWVQKIGEVLASTGSDDEKDVELNKLLATNYVHNNFYIAT